MWRPRHRTATLTAGLVAAAVLLFAVSTSGAKTKPQSFEDFVFPPFGFVVQGTNGYTVNVIVARKDKVAVLAGQGATGVFYLAPATRSNPLKAIKADLGTLGQIDVQFHPRGKGRFKLPCGGPRGHYRRGQFTGTIEFHGENGYTDVAATSAKAISFGNGGCQSFGAVYGFGGLGAELIAENGTGSIRLDVLAHRQGAPAGFRVESFERLGAIQIQRTLGVKGPPGSFIFDGPRSHATIAPPLPFHGTAEFKRYSRNRGSWLGDLTVDLPGLAGVRLAGDDFTGKLHRVDFSGSIIPLGG